MPEDGVDLLVRQGIPEGGHHAVEGPHRPSFMDHGVPVGIGFAGREFAVRKVRKLEGKTAFFERPSPSVRSVAGRAGLFIESGPV